MWLATKSFTHPFLINLPYMPRFVAIADSFLAAPVLQGDGVLILVDRRRRRHVADGLHGLDFAFLLFVDGWRATSLTAAGSPGPFHPHPGQRRAQNHQDHHHQSDDDRNDDGGDGKFHVSRFDLTSRIDGWRLLGRVGLQGARLLQRHPRGQGLMRRWRSDGPISLCRHRLDRRCHKTITYPIKTIKVNSPLYFTNIKPTPSVVS